MATLTDFNRNDNRNVPRSTCYCPVPTDAVSNASYTLTYTGGKLTGILKTDSDGNSFARSLNYTGDNLTGVTVWVEL